jgi:hypothetical protein
MLWSSLCRVLAEQESQEWLLDFGRNLSQLNPMKTFGLLHPFSFISAQRTIVGDVSFQTNCCPCLDRDLEMGENGPEQPTPAALSWDISVDSKTRNLFCIEALHIVHLQMKVLAALGALPYSEVVETKFPGPEVFKVGH